MIRVGCTQTFFQLEEKTAERLAETMKDVETHIQEEEAPGG